METMCLMVVINFKMETVEVFLIEIEFWHHLLIVQIVLQDSTFEAEVNTLVTE